MIDSEERRDVARLIVGMEREVTGVIDSTEGMNTE